MLERIVLVISLTIQLAGLVFIAYQTVVVARMLEHITQLILKTH
jgi:hypothetical protein